MLALRAQVVSGFGKATYAAVHVVLPSIKVIRTEGGDVTRSLMTFVLLF